MPRKAKVTKEDVVETALCLLREEGEGALNARAVAARLGVSTQPVFSNFPTMEKLRESLLSAAYDVYLGFLIREAERGEYPKYKAFGMAYIRFAKEEGNLFRFLFMCDRAGKELVPTPDFCQSVEMISSSRGVSFKTAERMHLELWTCVHGIATMLATSFLEFDWETVSEMLTDVYSGICARHASEDRK